MKIKGIIFDFNRTLYDPDANTLIEGSLELLVKLKILQYKLVLVCKKSASDRTELINSFGLDKFFCKVLMIEGSKTIEHFQECLLAMQLSALETAVVGDRVEEEICVGNHLGMVTIWLQQGKFSAVKPSNSGQEPTYTIYHLRDVPFLIQAC
jgi:FMN phosphatase YigB (HAD superfamily)